jgi:hypothetical protein
MSGGKVMACAISVSLSSVKGWNSSQWSVAAWSISSSRCRQLAAVVSCRSG